MRMPIAGAVALLAGAAAQGAFISFASDTSPANPTFVATFDDDQTVIRDFGPTNVDLLVDADEHGPLGPVTINANMTAEFTLSFAGGVSLGGPMYANVFSLAGFFEFRDAAGAMIVRGDIANGTAALTSIGTFFTAFSASMSGAGISYTLGTIGDIVGFTGTPAGDFGFTLTAINGGAGVDYIFPAPRAAGLSPVGTDDFTAEGSFSGSFVPTPGAGALLALGGLAMARRRR